MSRTSPRFPVTNAWLTNHVHVYKPRNITPSTMLTLAKKLLETDKPLQQLLRQCKTHWYLSVVIGQTTLLMDIYLDDLDDPKSDGLVSEAGYRKQAVFLKVNRQLQMEPVDELTVRRLRGRLPATYSTRHLRSSEIAVCDTLTEMLENVIPAPTNQSFDVDDMLSINMLSLDMELESSSPYRDIVSD